MKMILSLFLMMEVWGHAGDCGSELEEEVKPISIPTLDFETAAESRRCIFRTRRRTEDLFAKVGYRDLPRVDQLLADGKSVLVCLSIPSDPGLFDIYRSVPISWLYNAF